MAILSSIGGKLFNMAFGSVTMTCCCIQAEGCIPNSCCENSNMPWNAMSGSCALFNYIDAGQCRRSFTQLFSGYIKYDYNPRNYTTAYGVPAPSSPCTNFAQSHSWRILFSGSKYVTAITGESPTIFGCGLNCDRPPTNHALTRFATLPANIHSVVNVSTISGGNGTILWDNYFPLIDTFTHCSGRSYGGDHIGTSGSTLFACSGGTYKAQCIYHNLPSSPNNRLESYQYLGTAFSCFPDEKIFGFSSKYIPVVTFTASFIREIKTGNNYYLINCRPADMPDSTIGECFAGANRCKSISNVVINFEPQISGACYHGYNFDLNCTIIFERPPALTEAGSFDIELRLRSVLISGVTNCFGSIADLI